MAVHKHSFWLIGLCLIACQSPTAEFAPSPIPLTTPPEPTLTPTPTEEALLQLAEAFQTLRSIPGHFGGGPWHDDVDQWQGRKHQLMLALADELGSGAYGRSQLTTLLGPADHVVTGGDPLFEMIQSLPEYETLIASEVFLVYEWRGTHDFLFFAITNDHVTGSGWWYAGE